MAAAGSIYTGGRRGWGARRGWWGWRGCGRAADADLAGRAARPTDAVGPPLDGPAAPKPRRRRTGAVDVERADVARGAAAALVSRGRRAGCRRCRRRRHAGAGDAGATRRRAP